MCDALTAMTPRESGLALRSGAPQIYSGHRLKYQRKHFVIELSIDPTHRYGARPFHWLDRFVGRHVVDLASAACVWAAVRRFFNMSGRRASMTPTNSALIISIRMRRKSFVDSRLRRKLRATRNVHRPDS